MHLMETWAARQNISPGRLEPLYRLSRDLGWLAQDLGPEKFSRLIDPERALRMARWLDLPGIAGILGVGVLLPTRDSAGVPVMVADASLQPHWLAAHAQDATPFDDDQPVWLVLEDFGLAAQLREVGVWVQYLPAPQPQHCSPGDRVDIVPPRDFGTLGCRVQLPNGRLGVTTAGHVAPSKNAVAEAQGSRIGTVLDTSELTNSGPGVPCVDLALIELDDRHTDGSGLPFAGMATAAAGDDLEVHTTSGTVTGWARTGLHSLWWTKTTGTWGNTLITDVALTVGGDSGAPVELQSAPGRIIGHAVAGSSGYTAIQDLDYQLRHFNAQFRS